MSPFWARVAADSELHPCHPTLSLHTPLRLRIWWKMNHCEDYQSEAKDAVHVVCVVSNKRYCDARENQAHGNLAIQITIRRLHHPATAWRLDTSRPPYPSQFHQHMTLSPLAHLLALTSRTSTVPSVLPVSLIRPTLLPTSCSQLH